MEIEKLDLDVKTYNRLKKKVPHIRTVNELLSAMYLPGATDRISTPDMKRIEAAMKAAGIIKYMRGDDVREDDIDPEPLTWDELHDYVGKLIVKDCSTESHRWLTACWIYEIDDAGDTRLSYISRSNSFSTTRKAHIESSRYPNHPFLKHSGKFFVLKSGVHQHPLSAEESLEEEYRYDEHREVFGRELNYDELAKLPPETALLVYDSASETDHDDDIYGEPYSISPVQYGSGVRIYYEDEFYHELTILPQHMTPVREPHLYTRIWLMNKPGETEENGMIETGMRTPPADTNLAVTERYTQAYNLNVKIWASIQAVQQNLYDMCTAIKEMRDSKLYKELGYSSFEAYTEECLGMKRRQAYNYIQIIDKLPADFVQPVAQIGMHKLLLLTALTDDQREELTQTVDLESTTVRELREQIAALQAAKDTAEADAAQAKDAVREAEEAKERNRLTLRGIIDKKVELVHQLEAKVKELENRPVETAVVDHTEEIDALKAEIGQLRAQLAEKPDTQLALGVEPIYQNDSKALFKPYLTAAADAVNRLAEFIAQHQNDSNYDFFIEKMQAAFDFANQKIKMMKEA